MDLPRTPRVMRMVMLPLLVSLAVIGIGPLAGAASPAPSSPSSPTAPASPPSGVPSMDVFSDHVTAQLLARSGVAVYLNEQATQPVVPLAIPEASRVTSWQLRNMAAEARTGGGIAGSDLDRAVRLKGTKLPFSYLLAAWLSTSGSAGATTLRDHMGAQVWTDAPELVYPTLALELFTVDMATAGGQVAIADRPSPTALASVADAASIGEADVGFALGPVAAGGPASALDTACSAVTGFINGALDSIFGALQIDPSSLGTGVPANVLRFLAGIWDTAVGLARGVVDAAISQLTAPIVQAIRIGIGVIALISQVASYLKPWAITVEATPTALQVPFAAPGATGSFRARADVSVQSEQWPPILVDCARALGKTLPELAAAGAPTSWGVWGTAPGLATITTPGATSLALARDRTSTIAYETLVDPPENVDGPLLYDEVWATVTVQRKEVGELQDMVSTFAFGQLQGPVLTVVEATIKPQVDRLLKDAASLLSPLLDARGRSQEVVLAHHGPPTPSPTPGTGTCTGSPIPPGSYTGTATSDETIQPGSSVTHAHSTGPLSIQVAADGSVTGTWSYTTDFVSDVDVSGVQTHYERTWVMTGGAISGSICDLVLHAGTIRDTGCVSTPADYCTHTPIGTHPAGGQQDLDRRRRQAAARSCGNEAMTTPPAVSPGPTRCR